MTVSQMITACGGLCGQWVSSSVIYKDQNKAIISIVKDCGATTAPATTYYIIPLEFLDNIDSDSPKIRRKYKLFLEERGDVAFNWKSNNELEVIYDFPILYGRQGDFFYQANQVDGVKIIYKQKQFELGSDPF